MLFSRRDLLFGTLAAPVLAAGKQPAAQRPNVVLMVGSDLGAYVLGCYGNPEIRTPNLDRLAQTGVRFSHSFASAPTAPEMGWQAVPTDLFAQAGYNCGSNPLAKVPDFLDAQSPAKPFLLVVSWPSPFSETAPQKNVELYAKASFEKVGWDPAAPNATRKDMLKDVPGNLRKYAAAVTTLDEQVPALLAKLQQRGFWDNTTIIFTSRNGCLLGRHGLWGDSLASEPPNMYEEVVQVPLIWAWPSRFPPQSVCNEVVSSEQLLPTLCELTGAPTPAGNPVARSYLTFLYGNRLPKKQIWPGLAFARAGNTEMARDNRYKLILRDQGKGSHELYDVVADPRERVDRYDDSQFVSVRDRLTAALAGRRGSSNG